MLQHLQPLRSVFIPTRMFFNPHLPPTTLLTWIQLRCLAPDGAVTPALSILQLTQITSKSQATLYRHLSQLRSITALGWRFLGDGRIIISFPDNLFDKPKQSFGFPELTGITASNSYHKDLPQPAHYFPKRILGYLSYQDDQNE
jgi:hypothetical protein